MKRVRTFCNETLPVILMTLFGVLTLLGIFLAHPLTAQAATDTDSKVKSVSINISGEGFDDFGYPMLHGEAKSGKYEVLDITRDNLLKDEEKLDNEEYDETKKNPVEKETYTAILQAADGYKFNGTKKDSVSIHGANAECTGVSTKESGKQLWIKLKLKGQSEFVGNIPDGSLVQTDTVIGWGQAKNAGSYTLIVISGVTPRYTITDVGGTRYDLAPIMTKAGTYEVRVFPVSNLGAKGEFTDTVTFNVSQELAQKNFNQYKIEMVYEDNTKPSTGHAVNLGWQQNDKGWFWRNSDGTILQTQWLFDNNKWYYFDEQGAMVTNKWLHWKGKDYYFGADGAMLVNTTTPDGYTVDASGVWVQK